MIRRCVICGMPTPSRKNLDALVDLGWAALQEGRGPRHYFCPTHSAKEIVDWFAKDTKIGKILRGEVPAGPEERHDPE